jgi:methylglyoxal synthase
MGCQYQDFGYLNMSRGIGGIDSDIGDVITSQGLDALVQFRSPLVIPMETDVAEIRLH